MRLPRSSAHLSARPRTPLTLPFSLREPVSPTAKASSTSLAPTYRVFPSLLGRNVSKCRALCSWNRVTLLLESSAGERQAGEGDQAGLPTG